jgi:hypothetical protein
MGYHIILNLKCQLLPEFIPFIRDKYLRNGDESDDEDDHEYEQQGMETTGHRTMVL